MVEMQVAVVEKEQERVAAMYALILILVENLEAQARRKAWVEERLQQRVQPL
jgi:hypothetical protein